MNKTSLFSLLAVLIFITAAIFSATHPRRTAETFAPAAITPPENNTPVIYPEMDSMELAAAAQSQVTGSIAAPLQPNTISDPKVFWVKVAFSAVFCIAALWVVLSGKYDAETKKWAFSVLTLIAGVWIGSII